jgi:hypothetical protein
MQTRAGAHYQWPELRRVWPDLVAFALGLGLAWALHWTTTDLVWSLWLGSLVLGYLTILSTIGGGVYMGIKAITHPDFPRKHVLTAILIGSGVALFMLGFFSLHFCGFHAGHAGFLSIFFPLKGLPERVFFDAFMNPFLLWKMAFQHVLPVYGLFLIPAIIAERKYVFASLLDFVREVRVGMNKPTPQDLAQSVRGGRGSSRDPFLRPYLNVVRMHLLIFFFAFCHLLKVDSFLVYAAVYFVYFFPWKAITKESARAESAAA